MNIHRLTERFLTSYFARTTGVIVQVFPYADSSYSPIRAVMSKASGPFLRFPSSLADSVLNLCSLSHGAASSSKTYVTLWTDIVRILMVYEPDVKS